jgi:hypothetical protein
MNFAKIAHRVIVPEKQFVDLARSKAPSRLIVSDPPDAVFIHPVKGFQRMENTLSTI